MFLYSFISYWFVGPAGGLERETRVDFAAVCLTIGHCMRHPPPVAALPERAQCRKAPPSRRATQAAPSGTVSLTQIPRHPLHYYIFLDFTFTLAKDLGWLCPIVILK